MVNDKKTKTKLLRCAMKEFLDKGYMKASLRNICKEAGVTTGALYFFFKDKEDLLGSLVDEPLKELHMILKSHFVEEIDASVKLAKGEITIEQVPALEGFEDDMEMAENVVVFLFKHKRIFELLLTKSQGSRYENISDQIVNMVEEHYIKIFAIMKGYTSEEQITDEDRFIVHWMSHDQIDIFIHVLTHCKDRQEASRQMKDLMAYIIGGWYGVINAK